MLAGAYFAKYLDAAGDARALAVTSRHAYAYSNADTDAAPVTWPVTRANTCAQPDA